MQSISDGTLNALVIAALIVFAMVQLARMIERHSPMNRDDYSVEWPAEPERPSDAGDFARCRLCHLDHPSTGIVGPTLLDGDEGIA